MSSIELAHEMRSFGIWLAWLGLVPATRLVRFNAQRATERAGSAR